MATPPKLATDVHNLVLPDAPVIAAELRELLELGPAFEIVEIPP